jgi:signal transduction histidine kinase
MTGQAMPQENLSTRNEKHRAPPPERRAKQRQWSPLTIVALASVLTIVITAWLVHQIWRSYQDHESTQRHSFHIDDLNDKIVFFDEVLTMSANMAAATGDPHWEKRYRQVEPELDKAIKTLRKLVPKTFDSQAAAQTDAANIKLVEMENDVFELVGAQHLDQARTILTSREYLEQKKLYSDGMQRITSDLGDYVEQDIESHRTRALVAIISAAAGLIVLSGIWLIVLSNMRRYLKERNLAERQRERLLRTLAAKNEELQSIVYVASHDLKSPLVNIQGFSGELSKTCRQIEEILNEDSVPGDLRRRLATLLDEDVPESIKFICAGTVKMRTLLDGLLEVSRLGSAVLEIKTLDMNEMTMRIIESMQFQINDSQADVTVDNLPPCKGDEDQLNQVFSNLLINAVKYLDPSRKGVVRISGRIENGISIFCVQDNGSGIAQAHQEKVFEIFHRLDPGGKVTGQGLGLTIVHRILERHEGKIWIESEPGTGSKFFVSLPNA